MMGRFSRSTRDVGGRGGRTRDRNGYLAVALVRTIAGVFFLRTFDPEATRFTTIVVLSGINGIIIGLVMLSTRLRLM